jgi:hypothetical protein
MNQMIERAKSATTSPEVVEAMKLLAKHGLGVCMPHAHDANGDFVELASGIVAYEEDLKVSFYPTGSTPTDKVIAVGWRWNTETSAIEEIQRCAAWC